MAKRTTTRPRPLDEYRAKRDFTKTPEPSGAGKARAEAKAKGGKSGPSFCVQKHLASHLHYDFRLEHRGVLLSWAVPKGPSLNPRDRRLAMRTEDHPLDYGQFEGVIPDGYGAGVVMLWDQGTWRPEAGFGDVDAALDKGELKFTLDGFKLKGSWVLVRTKGGARFGGDGADGRTWLLIKHRDAWAGDVDITTFAPISVTSGGDFADILAADKPDVWESHQPARGGAAGAMLREVIEEAKRIKEGRTLGRPGKRPPAKRSQPATRSRKRKVVRKPSSSAS
jgi:bifunctional non-homologous end joining protein LigD